MAVAFNFSSVAYIRSYQQRKQNNQHQIGDKDFELVYSFVYLGGVVTGQASSEGDIQRRIGLAIGTLQKQNILRGTAPSIPNQHVLCSTVCPGMKLSKFGRHIVKKVTRI